jgi:osmotically-inducible protein OsmY
MQRRMRARLVSAATLQDQVRSRIAELVSHPDAILVTVEGGLVRVSGDVLSNEMEVLLLELTQLPGVHKVHNALSAIPDPARFDERRGATGECDEVQS